MLNAYFDESGDDTDQRIKIVGMAGCLAPVQKWEVFEREWQSILDAAGIRYFHMKEFAHSVGEFATGWKGDEQKRTRLYGALWETIEKVTPMFFGCFIPMEYYRQVLSDEQRRQLGSAYFVTYQTCMSLVFMVALRGNGSERVATIFDDKSGVQHYLDAFYDYILKHHNFQGRIPRPIRQDMRTVLPLQAADIVAYESHKEYERRLYRPNQKPRWGLTRLEGLLREALPGQSFEFGNEGTPIIFRPTGFVDSIAQGFSLESDMDS